MNILTILQGIAAVMSIVKHYHEIIEKGNVTQEDIELHNTLTQGLELFSPKQTD